MPRIEVMKEISAPVEKIYKILNNVLILPRWNIVVNEVTLLEKDKYFLKTNVGDIINIVYENIPNKSISSTQEKSPMTALGYIIEPKGDGTLVKLWADFELEDQRMILEMAGDMFLKSLKVYVDHVMSGANPEEYKKKLSKINKA